MHEMFDPVYEASCDVRITLFSFFIIIIIMTRQPDASHDATGDCKNKVTS